MAKEARVLALLALGMVMAACSGGGSGASAPSTPKAEVSREDYAQRLAEWLCDDLAACCDASGESVDRASCVDVKRKAELLNLDLPNDVAEYIANHLKQNIRQLEGAVKKLNAYYLLEGIEPCIA